MEMKQSYLPPKKKRKVDRLYDFAEKQRREQLRDEREREKPRAVKYGEAFNIARDTEH
jgi:hypothetical protein